MARPRSSIGAGCSTVRLTELNNAAASRMLQQLEGTVLGPPEVGRACWCLLNERTTAVSVLLIMAARGGQYFGDQGMWEDVSWDICLQSKLLKSCHPLPTTCTGAYVWDFMAVYVFTFTEHKSCVILPADLRSAEPPLCRKWRKWLRRRQQAQVVGPANLQPAKARRTRYQLLWASPSWSAM